jgi:hypothetical protein
MSHSRCPVCGSEEFYVKDPDDEYETYGCVCDDGDLRFDDSVDREQLPDVSEDTETFCNRCAWHDRLAALKKG